MIEPVVVVVPTRGSAAAIRNVAAHIATHVGNFPCRILVNSDEIPDAETLADLRRSHPDVRLHLCPGGGVSRARNLALATYPQSTVVFVDDDVILAPGVVESLLDALTWAQTAVATARIVPAPAPRELFEVHERYLGLDRGGESRTFGVSDLESMTPMSIWPVGVGALFAVRAPAVAAASPSGVSFDERLSNGLPCGGTEDVDFFLRCLTAGVGIHYAGDVVARHEYPASLQLVRSKVRHYSRADGAFYGKWSRLLRWRDVRADLVHWVYRVGLHVRLWAVHAPHVPLGPLLMEPGDKLYGAVRWRFGGAP